jgi:hypothetical protein
MILVFKLSMPSSAAWDGKWSGAGKFYAKVENLGRSNKATERGNKIVEECPYRYDFGDGWVASISVTEVNAKGARAARKASQGFCGYDWMVTNILLYGSIKIPEGNKNADQP